MPRICPPNAEKKYMLFGVAFLEAAGDEICLHSTTQVVSVPVALQVP